MKMTRAEPGRAKVSTHRSYPSEKKSRKFADRLPSIAHSERYTAAHDTVAWSRRCQRHEGSRLSLPETDRAFQDGIGWSAFEDNILSGRMQHVRKERTDRVDTSLGAPKSESSMPIDFKEAICVSEISMSLRSLNSRSGGRSIQSAPAA